MTTENTTKKDAFNHLFEVGDKVIFTDSCCDFISYKDRPTIVGFTNCYVYVKYPKGHKFKISPEKLLYVEDQLQANMDKNPEDFI